MASAGALAAVQSAGLVFKTGAAFTPGLGLLGFALTAGAGFIDQQFLFPAILGSPQEAARPPRLVELPTMTVGPTAPRIWAIGRLLRVPCHVMFQSDKVRESTPGGSKGGQAGTIRRVFSDAAVFLNDRLTAEMVQLWGSGKLTFWRSRNLAVVLNDAMTVVESGGQLVITASNSLEPDFTDLFAVGSQVRLEDWVITSGTDINVGYWECTAVTGHTASGPSSITVTPKSGQSIVGTVDATAGTPETPAVVRRIDDSIIEHDLVSALNVFLAPGIPSTTRWRMDLQGLTEAQRRTFENQTEVRLTGFSPAALNGHHRIEGQFDIGADRKRFFFEKLDGTIPNPITSPSAGTSSNAATIEPWSVIGFLPGMFATSPGDGFHPGDDTQTEDSVIARHEATGTIPGFRGQSYVTLDQFDLSSHFGNSMPLLEALIRVDEGFTWRDALVEICARSGIEGGEIDTQGVTPRAFQGYRIRGAMPGAIALQPVLTAGQIAAQARDDVLAFFEIDNADVVAIENGVAFSDLGAVSGIDTPNVSDKILYGQPDEGALPTSITVRHMDTDAQHTDGSQPFGLRNPTRLDHVLETDLDFSGLALSRKDARNLAATVMRRTWINAHTVEVSLPVAYVHVLENDLLTVTDDSGEVVTCRILRREMGANLLVNVVAVREQLALSVAGSPVQTSTIPDPPVVQAYQPVVRILDIPPLRDEDGVEPGFYVAACAPRGSRWNGAIVLVSRDGGTTYTQEATLTTECGIGRTTSDLLPGTHAEVIAESGGSGPTPDTVRTVSVDLDAVGPIAAPLTGTDDDVVNLQYNWMHISDGTTWEILGARDVVDNGDENYTFSRLFRGLRGTLDAADGTRLDGAEVTMLYGFHLAGVFVRLGTNDVPATIKVKVVPTGVAPSAITAIDVTINGWNARPMPVVDFDFVNGAGNDRTFTFRHWSRLVNPIGFQGPFPLGTAHEGYRVKIYDKLTGQTLQRIKRIDSEGTGSPTLQVTDVLYTAAEQTTDGYTPGASETFWVEIEQLGDFGEDPDETNERAGGRAWRQQI